MRVESLRFFIVSLGLGVLLTPVGVGSASVVTAQDKEQTTTKTGDALKNDTTNTGFATGTKCAKTSVYRAGNKYLEIILVVAEGEEFPLFVDGEKTIWYELKPGAKSSFEPIKVTAGSN